MGLDPRVQALSVQAFSTSCHLSAWSLGEKEFL